LSSLAALATVILLLQTVFSLYQVKYYNNFVKKLAQKYSEAKGYHLTTEVAKHLMTSIVAVVITDEKDTIIELYFYSGLTIFSRFRRFKTFDGKLLDSMLLIQLEQEKSKLKQKVFKQLINKKMEAITI
jgi:DNA-binding transcriptional regulator of glucitol operon